MSDKGITLEGLAAAVDALRQELATWTALAHKQDQLSADQITATQSGITAAAVQQIADNATAIAGKQDALTAAQQAAVDSGATAAKIDQIASNASAIVSLTSSKQDALSTTQLAAVNSGITSTAVQQISTNTGDIATKAADNSVVHLAGAETITGDKTWTGLNTFQYTVVFKDGAAVSAGRYGVGLGFYDYEGNRYGYIQPHITSDGTKNIVFGNSASGYLEFASFLVPYANNTVGLGTSSNAWSVVYADTVYANTSFGVRYASKTASGQPAISGYIQRAFGVKSSDDKYFSRFNSQIGATYSRTEFETNLYDSNSDVLASVKIQHVAQYNSSTGTTSLYVRPTVSGVVDLGLVSNKWKSLNGINPGALGLQNFNAGITLDTTNWDKTGEYGVNANFWTPTVNGWLTVLITGTPGTGWVQLSQADSLGQFSVCLSTGYAWATIPVVANVSCKICLLCSTVSAKFYPCLGNV